MPCDSCSAGWQQQVWYGTFATAVFVFICVTLEGGLQALQRDCLQWIQCGVAVNHTASAFSVRQQATGLTQCVLIGLVDGLLVGSVHSTSVVRGTLKTPTAHVNTDESCVFVLPFKSPTGLTWWSVALKWVGDACSTCM
jgi:hypothetical protein